MVLFGGLLTGFFQSHTYIVYIVFLLYFSQKSFSYEVKFRWLRLYYSVCCISDAFAKMIADWEEQSKVKFAMV